MDSQLFKRILDITVEIANEKNHLVLLEKILIESMSISNCDAGTLYIQENGKLKFTLMRTVSLNIFKGAGGEVIDLPPVEINENSVAGYCALKREIISVEDVYNDPKFIWDGPKKYDKLTGYHTQSLLVVPLVDKSEHLIGVLQLLNAQDKDSNKIIPFENEIRQVILSLGSQSAVILSNMLLLQNIKELLDSFVSAMTTAIDSRTPYNANHTVNVAKLCGGFADYLNTNTDFNVPEADKEELIMAAMLHDVGKMVIPLNVLNKATRFEGKFDLMKMRYNLIDANLLVKLLDGDLTKDEYKEEKQYLDSSVRFVDEINTIGYVDDSKIERLKEIASKSYESNYGELKILTEEEMQDASIRRGTLTGEERKEIENHVVYTSKILSQIEFGERYEHVPFIAGAHHEYLDGSGYPNHLKEEELPLSVRIITIMDVYESLTSTDRPYKKPMPKEKAYNILCEMVDEGKLDGELVNKFKGYIGL